MKKQTETNNIKIPKRFYSLDVLRGLASLAVVFWHWQHFFYIGTKNPGFDKSIQPFFSIFKIFYLKGYLGVDFFFALSGFIFFWLYTKKIANKEIGGFKFFILRISRLYPLHLLTLILVVIGQIISKYITGGFTIYPFNDLYHFILNIFLISNWGFQDGYSFNAPIWSVSIEAFLYIIFFVFAYFGAARSIIKTIAIVALCIFLKGFMNPQIYRGIMSFFIGGTTLLIYKNIYHFKTKHLAILIGIITAGLWTLVFVNMQHNLHVSLISRIPNLLGSHKIIALIFEYYVVAILFPFTILSLTLIETVVEKFGYRLRALGDISYSTYLWHFPLELLFILINKSQGLGSEFFTTKISTIIFFSTLIAISYISYQKFERPIQQYIRNKL